MVDFDKTVETLKQVSLFKNLNKRQLNDMARMMIERQCAAGEVIVPQGRDGYGFFILVSGHAEAVLEQADGTKAVVNTFDPGDFFGELALLDGGPRTASVVATEPTLCLILPHESFMSILKRDSEIAIAILQELTRRFRATLSTL